MTKDTIAKLRAAGTRPVPRPTPLWLPAVVNHPESLEVIAAKQRVSLPVAVGTVAASVDGYTYQKVFDGWLRGHDHEKNRQLIEELKQLKARCAELRTIVSILTGLLVVAVVACGLAIWGLLLP